MAIFMTGGTGFIGSYVLAGLLERCDEPVFVLARRGSAERMWRALQHHFDFETFQRHLDRRLTVLDGDVTLPRFGLGRTDYDRCVRETESVLHVAASLNRKSEKSCLNVNLRGTLETVQLARRAPDLRRYSFVSTVAVAGKRRDELVAEEASIEWDRSDYDPYARTKKFCEHMIHELLPDKSRLIFRPSVVLGDSRRPETTQFDMVRAFAFLADLWVLPLRKTDRIDIVPVDYVADAITTLHLEESPAHDTYHLSAGADAENYAAITKALADARSKRPPRFWSWMEAPFAGTAGMLSRLHGTGVGKAASRIQVFMPYLTFNTVFDNARVAAALGRKPERFTDYCYPLLKWSLQHDFRYPYREYPVA